MKLERRLVVALAGQAMLARPAAFAAQGPDEALSPLERELLRRTEANKARAPTQDPRMSRMRHAYRPAEWRRHSFAAQEQNAAAIKKITEQNAFTAVSGAIPKSLVTDMDGTNIYLEASQIDALTRQGRLRCGVGEPCRIVARDAGSSEIELPRPQKLVCDDGGRRCRFRAIE